VVSRRGREAAGAARGGREGAYKVFGDLPFVARDAQRRRLGEAGRSSELDDSAV
jgi:hypothetical protein